MGDDVADPFEEDIPDFGDAFLNDAARAVTAGMETSRALLGIDADVELRAAIGALNEFEARMGLYALVMQVRASQGKFPE